MLIVSYPSLEHAYLGNLGNCSPSLPLAAQPPHPLLPCLPAGRCRGDTRVFPEWLRVITGRVSKEGDGAQVCSRRSPNRRQRAKLASHIGVKLLSTLLLRVSATASVQQYGCLPHNDPSHAGRDDTCRLRLDAALRRAPVHFWSLRRATLHHIIRVIRVIRGKNKELQSCPDLSYQHTHPRNLRSD